MGARRLRGDLGQSRLDQILYASVERPHRPLEENAFGQDVVGSRRGLEGGHRNDHLLHRIDVAAGDALKRQHHVARNDGRVDGEMWLGGMAPAPPDPYLEEIGRGKEWAWPDSKGAKRHPGPVVHAVDFLNAPAFHQPVLNHRAPATLAFFGRLEDDDHRAIESPRLGQVFGSAQQHRRVPVMPAGVHPPRHGRGIGEPSRLLDRQRIHIRPEPHDPARAGFAPPDHADNSGSPYSLDHLVTAKGAQPLSHQAGGAMDLEHQFGMGVKVVTPGRDLVMPVGKAVSDRHGAHCLSTWGKYPRGGPGGQTAPPDGRPVRAETKSQARALPTSFQTAGRSIAASTSLSASPRRNGVRPHSRIGLSQP